MGVVSVLGSTLSSPVKRKSVASAAGQSIKVDVRYLVIAGGGSGGGRIDGGGGAGGYRCNVPGESSGGNSSAEAALSFVKGTAYQITVGAGGTTPGGFNSVGTRGSDSVLGDIVSIGGGGPTTENDPDVYNGGSGGGGMHGSGRNPPVASDLGGIGTPGQGTNGAAGYYVGSRYPSGGGGGAGGAAVRRTSGSDAGGNGGPGLSSSITGTSVTRAGGGGGGTYSAGSPYGSGGSGGGGNGGGSGSANTGGGGGAQGNGGSGVIILSIPDTATLTFSNGVSQTSSTSGGRRIYVVTAAGANDTVTY